MSENVRKLIGVAIMAVLVVVGVVATSGGDDVDFTRNSAFLRMPKAQQARLIPAFAPQAASKASHLNSVGDDAQIVLQASGQIKAGIVLQSGGTDALGTGKASVLEGRGVDGKGGTSSFRAGTGVNGKTGKAGIWSTGGVDALSGRKAGIWLQNGGTEGVADRIAECASGGVVSGQDIEAIGVTNPLWTVASLKNVLVTSYMENTKDLACLPQGGTSANLNQKSEQLTNFDQKTNQFRVGKDEAELLATCMESKVDGVLLKSHIAASAEDCVAIVLPELSPDRAIQLGIYWQTQQQLVDINSYAQKRSAPSRSAPQRSAPQSSAPSRSAQLRSAPSRSAQLRSASM